LLGLHWPLLAALALWKYRPRGLVPADYSVIALASVLCFLYFWVAYEVFHRRSRVWSIAVGCAGIWIFGFPTGTVVAFLLVANLVASKYDYSK
jgi:uncharacterized membrane protein